MNLRLSKQNQRGQMAIFVALIFQVLFLFFAMAINIGLVVHDKINLQNAVDLAAFYAAQKQAEQLNVIAHTNYQIRQSWKLLNWRYYVLGTMGTEPHPAMRGGFPRSEDTMWPPVAIPPSLCVTYNPVWASSRGRGGQDNPCKSQNFNVPNIEVPRVVAPFLPFNIIFARFAQSVQQKIKETCEGYAGYNWLFAASAYTAYLLDQKTRKELIRALAKNLAKKPEEILDLKGSPVIVGAQKTFEKNLTHPNNPKPDSPPVIEMFNSLEGLNPQQWLSETDIWYTMFYQDMNTSGNSCSSVVRQITDIPTGRSWADLVAMTGDEAILQALANYVRAGASIGAGDSRRISIGVEKNPWYLAYVGVKAKTRPRQLFFPFGEPVQFEARAFAQPFGGRVGPWYARGWARGAEASSGDRVQLSPEKLLANGMLNSSQAAMLMPQYSKYPGDKMGLRSLLAQASLVNQGGIRTSLYDYAHITEGFGPANKNDILADSQSPDSSIRRYEMAAIAPDLFDITYYSIQPNFGERYLRDLRGNRQRFGLSDEAFPRGDLGAKDPDGSKFSVKDQIEFVKGNGGTVPNLQAPDAFWFVRNREHLLTSWVHNDTYGEYFAFPRDRFGRCQEFDDNLSMKSPGSCVDRGGRAGYSVKIISPEMLRTALPLGGVGQGEGVILNPPPAGW
jgi:hypothetical protein